MSGKFTQPTVKPADSPSASISHSQPSPVQPKVKPFPSSDRHMKETASFGNASSKSVIQQQPPQLQNQKVTNQRLNQTAPPAQPPKPELKDYHYARVVNHKPGNQAMKQSKPKAAQNAEPMEEVDCSRNQGIGRLADLNISDANTVTMGTQTAWTLDKQSLSSRAPGYTITTLVEPTEILRTTQNDLEASKAYHRSQIRAQHGNERLGSSQQIVCQQNEISDPSRPLFFSHDPTFPRWLPRMRTGRTFTEDMAIEQSIIEVQGHRDQSISDHLGFSNFLSSYQRKVSATQETNKDKKEIQGYKIPILTFKQREDSEIKDVAEHIENNERAQSRKIIDKFYDQMYFTFNAQRSVMIGAIILLIFLILFGIYKQITDSHCYASSSTRTRFPVIHVHGQEYHHVIGTNTYEIAPNQSNRKWQFYDCKCKYCT